jgi:hypothetical protein
MIHDDKHDTDAQKQAFTQASTHGIHVLGTQQANLVGVVVGVEVLLLGVVVVLLVVEVLLLVVVVLLLGVVVLLLEVVVLLLEVVVLLLGVVVLLLVVVEAIGVLVLLAVDVLLVEVLLAGLTVGVGATSKLPHPIRGAVPSAACTTMDLQTQTVKHTGMRGLRRVWPSLDVCVDMLGQVKTSLDMDKFRQV